jgi:hypothetical protein
LYHSFILCRIGGEVLPEAASTSLGSSSIHNTIYSSGSVLKKFSSSFLKKLFASDTFDGHCDNWSILKEEFLR